MCGMVEKCTKSIQKEPKVIESKRKSYSLVSGSLILYSALLVGKGREM